MINSEDRAPRSLLFRWIIDDAASSEVSEMMGGNMGVTTSVSGYVIHVIRCLT
jgi:hypothetical protein